MQTKDKRYIVAGGYQNKLYILDAEDGTLLNTLDYPLNGPGYVFQIAEVRPNILITADDNKASLHDIRDIQNIPPSLKLPDIGNRYRTVIALESNPGDFAIGVNSSSTSSNFPYGFVYIQHLGDDNQTLTTINYAKRRLIYINFIKEIKRGTIIFDGSIFNLICLWNYAAILSQDPLCWNKQTTSDIYDILQVPY